MRGRERGVFKVNATMRELCRGLCTCFPSLVKRVSYASEKIRLVEVDVGPQVPYPRAQPSTIQTMYPVHDMDSLLQWASTACRDPCGGPCSRKDAAGRVHTRCMM